MTFNKPRSTAVAKGAANRAKQAETAAQAHSRNVDEALRRIELIKDALEQEQARAQFPSMHKPVHWGDVGSMAAVVEALGQAGHHAGVEELTEK